jgi:hypothetical protein
MGGGVLLVGLMVFSCGVKKFDTSLFKATA